MNDELLRQVFLDRSWNYDEYSRLIAHAEFDRIIVLNGSVIRDSARFSGIHINKWMRFGNSIFQLSNVIQLCIKAKLPMVYYFEEHPFFGLSVLEKTTGVPFVKKARAEFIESDGLVLSGNFFFDTPFKLFEGRERQQVLDEHVAHLLPSEFLNGTKYVDDSTLTVHIRAGDIFSNLIHKQYGQPPLAYYKSVLNASGAKRILILFEDMGNPVIVPLVEYARQKGFEVVMYCGGLEETLTILFNSTELVGGIGSFLWAVQSLSQKLKKYWFFDRVFDRSVFARSGLRVARVSDVSGNYVDSIMRNNWENTPEQRQLMVEYPVSALAIEEW